MTRHERLLAIDSGNTRIKWAVNEDGAWVDAGAIATADSGRLGEAWSALRFDRAIACNVAGPEIERRLRAACAARGASLAIALARARELGVANGYRDPARLGADRWAALIAAHALGPGAKLVVNAGTALTIDALGADGRFEGGLIVPGPALMRASLASGTAGLPRATGTFRAFPDSTEDAIASGALQACVGAVARMRHAMTERGMVADSVVLSGGAGRELAPLLPMPFAFHENLVLDGLARIARQS